MKIRIVHVLNRWATGGTEGGVARIANRLLGDFEHIICSIHPPSEGPAVAAELQCLDGNSKWSALSAVMRKTRPHIVHSRNWGAIEAIVAARLVNVPAIIHSEHGRNLDTMSALPWRQRYFRRLCYRIAHELFAVTEELREYYVMQIGAAAKRMAVIENGVDVERYRRDLRAQIAIREQLGIDQQRILIGCVARLDPVKDHATLLLASAELLKANYPVHVLVVGDGPERSRLEQLAAGTPSLREHVTFTGQVCDVIPWLSALDIFVLPSLSEGMSNVLLEAMAVGVAPVATAVGGNTRILDGGRFGRVFPAGDVAMLTDRLRELIVNRERCTEIGCQARLRVEQRYGMERMLESYARLYTNVLERNSRKPWAQPTVNTEENAVKMALRSIGSDGSETSTRRSMLARRTKA